MNSDAGIGAAIVKVSFRSWPLSKGKGMQQRILTGKKTHRRVLRTFKSSEVLLQIEEGAKSCPTDQLQRNSQWS